MLEIGGVGILIAVFAGTVSFLSPCVLPLVPGYLATVTGGQGGDLENVSWRRVVPPSLLFIATFSTIFVLLGLGLFATLQGAGINIRTLERIAGVLIIAMGILFVGQLLIARLNAEWHIEALMQRAGRGGPMVVGAAFAVAWTPCIGPTLAAILALSTTTGSIAQAAALLGFYSLGLAVPFLLTGIAFAKMTAAFEVIKRHYLGIMAAGGAVLVVMGVLVFTGELFQLNIRAQQLLDDLGINFFNEV